MAIITKQDMLDRFGERELIERTDRERYEQINDVVLNRAMADAEAEANAYLQAAALVLATPMPKVLVIKVCDIARYYLYDDAVTQIIEDRYKQAVTWLRDVVRNPQMLDATATPTTTNPSQCSVLPNQPDTWASFVDL
ncbi:gp436 family protein [Vitreoscilla stercoraria]|uniref:DUF1320 domain-containing protein n=1 Tax=Vitreoscilla stercoraria TaxID=61 RepID=A0ABY4EF79_VITST|nr:DUF1320 domain-containing protein [Vitreoscilla stercoraria]UOO93585.1 DUF1320 domain-containing protein [Vitreoscilla stercoraria]